MNDRHRAGGRDTSRAAGSLHALVGPPGSGKTFQAEGLTESLGAFGSVTWLVTGPELVPDRLMALPGVMVVVARPRSYGVSPSRRSGLTTEVARGAAKARCGLRAALAGSPDVVVIDNPNCLIIDADAAPEVTGVLQAYLARGGQLVVLSQSVRDVEALGLGAPNLVSVNR